MHKVILLISAFLFLTIKQSIFNDTIEWSWNIATSIFVMLLGYYIDWLDKKDEK